MEGEEPRDFEASVKALFPDALAGRRASDIDIDTLVVHGGRSRVRDRIAKGCQSTWVSAVTKALAAADGTSAPGMSGLRMSILKMAVQEDGSGGVVRTISEWVDGICGGGAGGLARTLRFRLIPKANGGVRPIGVGEAVVGVAKRVVATALTEQVGDWLKLHGQWGVAVADGCRVLSAAMAKMWDAGWAVAGLDVKDAFNSVHRRDVVEAVVERDRQLAPFVAWTLAPTTLVGEGGSEVVERGVVQGDPLSPVLFALVLAKATRRVHDRCREAGVRLGLLVPGKEAVIMDCAAEGGYDALLGWYADDGTVAWKDERSFRVVVEQVVLALAEVGLELSATKCQVVAGRGCGGEVVESVCADLGMRVAPMLSVLGVPLGDVAMARLFVSGAVEESEAELRKLWELGNPLAEIAVLRTSGLGVCVRWLLEAAPVGVVTEELMAKIRAAEEALVRHALGPEGETASEAVMRQAVHPTKQGGLGMVSIDRCGVARDGRWVPRGPTRRTTLQSSGWWRGMSLRGGGGWSSRRRRTR